MFRKYILCILLTRKFSMPIVSPVKVPLKYNLSIFVKVGALNLVACICVNHSLLSLYLGVTEQSFAKKKSVILIFANFTKMQD